MENKISWGIIGCGDVAELKSGPAFQKCENSQLLAVMRRDYNLAKDFATRHRVALYYDNADQLLENPDINAIYVATPPSTHLYYALKALQAGKNVYVEKPMVLSENEALQLQNEVNNSPNMLVVAHYRRFLPMYIKVKELLNQHIIGPIKFVDLKFLKPHNFKDKAGWRLDAEVSGGGYFHDIAPHQIDLMTHFFGDFQLVKGIAINQSKLSKVDDTVNGIIHFKNKVQFRGIWSFSIPKYLEEDSCTIYGEMGTLSFSFYEETLKLNTNSENQVFNFKNPKHIQQPLIQETVNYFLGKRNNPCDVKVGVTVTSIMEQFTKNT
ncbi:MAG: Gfo/Idh/MocA family oxidoreductase [Flavobacteriales bacterium]|nr:Gfo/Idh/MocA family oxidoreductase [Flavobacteriales bacterium]NCP51525.1 Gfo/Idh/MocA family oxidoreductase [Flavobacteriales bacterium]NCP59889.1 Gfo/Idh/MocA family oxidoreductase [Flavobacteriales bacterium]PIV94812.1 MAG: oxidoreductase [Flavobacteriaceae bacterium CG17_big_fil_post_rev_8_21_14_2_50_33_15]